MKYIVITGNPVDGLFFNGPFGEHDGAVEWAEREQAGEDWWVAQLVPYIPCNYTIEMSEHRGGFRWRMDEEDEGEGRRHGAFFATEEEAIIDAQLDDADRH